MFLYPWGDGHSLNLGWFLIQFKAWTEKIQEYLDNGGGTSENLANVIAPVFNAENSYLTGDYVLYNDELYKANQAVNPGTWDPNAWTKCLVTEEMGSAASGVDNVARLMIAGQYSNTYNYQKYAICRYNDKLWMCNTNLPAGGEEWEPSHWDEITVGAGLTGLRISVDTLSQAITDETTARQELDNDITDIETELTVTPVTRTYTQNNYVQSSGFLGGIFKKAGIVVFSINIRITTTLPDQTTDIEIGRIDMGFTPVGSSMIVLPPQTNAETAGNIIVVVDTTGKVTIGNTSGKPCSGFYRGSLTIL